MTVLEGVRQIAQTIAMVAARVVAAKAAAADAQIHAPAPVLWYAPIAAIMTVGKPAKAGAKEHVPLHVRITVVAVVRPAVWAARADVAPPVVPTVWVPAPRTAPTAAVAVVQDIAPATVRELAPAAATLDALVVAAPAAAGVALLVVAAASPAVREAVKPLQVMTCK